MEIETLIYGRIAERILIVLFGGLCLLFGFLLFSRVTQTQGDLEAKGGDKLYLRLRNVGPGVFFALFGAAVLVSSLAFQFSLDNFKPGKGTQQSSLSVRLGVSPTTISQVDITKSRIAALSALLTFYGDHSAKALEGAERSALLQALPILDDLRADFIDSVFGEGAYNFFQTVEGGGELARLNLKPSERSKFDKIKQSMAYGKLLDDPKNR